MNKINVFDNQNKIRIVDTFKLVSMQTNSSSKGNQRKWLSPLTNEIIKEQFYYQERYWRDDLVEVIASTLAQQMNLYNVKVVVQKPCIVRDGKKETFGVISTDFTNTCGKFVSINHLIKSIEGDMTDTKDIETRWFLVLNGLQKVTGLDLTNYLIVTSILDYLVGNEDRHLNNLGVTIKDNEFQVAPLFDFGLGLFEHDEQYLHRPFRECLALMQCKPFATDNQNVIDFIREYYANTIYDIKNYLPLEFDLTGVDVPSAKAGSYLRNRCSILGVVLKGVD